MATPMACTVPRKSIVQIDKHFAGVKAGTVDMSSAITMLVQASVTGQVSFPCSRVTMHKNLA